VELGPLALTSNAARLWKLALMRGQLALDKIAKNHHSFYGGVIAPRLIGASLRMRAVSKVRRLVGSCRGPHLCAQQRRCTLNRRGRVHRI